MIGSPDELVARLRRDPDDQQAFSALRQLYHQQGDWPSLANLLSGWAGQQRDPQRAAWALYEAGDLVLGALRDRQRAVTLYERALERLPGMAEPMVRLEAMAEEEGDVRRLAELIERRANAQASHDPRGAAEAFQRLGQMWQEHWHSDDRAVTFYRRAFELDPSLVSAIYAAREIYKTAGNLKAAAQLYEMEAAAEGDLGRRVSLYRELAHLRDTRMNDVPGAIAALDKALQADHADIGAMAELAGLLLRRAERGGKTAEPDRRRAGDLYYELAQRTPPEHALAYVQFALDVSPDNDGAIALLEQLAAKLHQPTLLPGRWVMFLSVAPDAPGAMEMRRRLGHAYVEAGQIDDAIVCFEPLLELGDAEAGESLVQLYERAGRRGDMARALAVAVQALPAAQRVPRLREIQQLLVQQGDRDGALARAQEILAIDASDGEALAFVEGELRKKGAFPELRDIMLAAARVQGQPPDARKVRLREVAVLSEQKLNDQGGAADAWRAICALDPADESARAQLRRLLETLERWDELVDVLERDSLSATDPESKADVVRRIAELHRVKRADLGEAAKSYRELVDLAPADHAARDALSEVLVELGAWREAAPLLKARIDDAPKGKDRVALMRLLAGALEEHLGDAEGAFEVSARLLDEEPGDIDALERMERIDLERERWDRLLQTLSYRAEVGQPDERARIFARMGALADQRLGDLDRAAEHYGQSLDLAPADTQVLDALCDVYDRGERYRDLVDLLRTRAEMEQDASVRAELWRRIARILDGRVRNEDAAAEAWEEVLRAVEDEEALRYLTGLHQRKDVPERLEDDLKRLAAIVPERDEARDMLVSRADLLVMRLERAADAIEVIRDVLDRLDPGHMPAITRLVALGERQGDDKLLAEALERHLLATTDEGLRAPLAERLATLYEEKLTDAPKAIVALVAWADADPLDAEPQRRLVRLLEPLGRTKELVAALDALAGLEQEDSLVSELTLRAADLSFGTLHDTDGAWNRLQPRVEEGDGAAETMLREIAKETSRGERLAELYVRLAQDEAGPQAKRWRDAAGVYETYLSDNGRALEAILRAFAIELDDEKTLDEVDRLAAGAAAWPRLGQVYETLLRRAETPERKRDLLVRHAKIVDEQAEDPSDALDRVLRACSLLPNDDDVLAYAEDLAPRAGRADELLVVYDRRRAVAKDDASRVTILLRAARTCDEMLEDREQAMHYVTQAVALSARTPELGPTIETAVRDLDTLRPELGQDAARRALADVYVKLAEATPDGPVLAAELGLRAARLLHEDLDDAPQAFDVLKTATSTAPGHVPAVDALESLARSEKRLKDLDEHFADLVREALDQRTAIELLRRRGRILTDDLDDASGAAEVYRQLLTLAPGDRDGAELLRATLRKAGKHQDLLVAIDRELESLRDPALRIALLKQSAQVWEVELRNRYEALDVWKRIRKAFPDDPEAANEVERLEKGTRRAAMDDEALLGEEPAPKKPSDVMSQLPPPPEQTDGASPFDDEPEDDAPAAPPPERETIETLEAPGEPRTDPPPAHAADAAAEGAAHTEPPAPDGLHAEAHAGAADGVVEAEALPPVPPPAESTGEVDLAAASLSDDDEAADVDESEVSWDGESARSSERPPEPASASRDDGEQASDKVPDVVDPSGLVALPDDGSGEVISPADLDAELDAVLEDELTPPPASSAPRTSVPPPPPPPAVRASVPPPPPPARSSAPPLPPAARGSMPASPSASIPPPPPPAAARTSSPPEVPGGTEEAPDGPEPPPPPLPRKSRSKRR